MLRRRQSRGSLPSIKITLDEPILDDFSRRRGSLSPKEGRRSLSPSPSFKGGVFSDLAKKVEVNRMKALDSPLLRTRWKKLTRPALPFTKSLKQKSTLSVDEPSGRLSRSASDYSVYENSVAIDLDGNHDALLSEVFMFVQDNNPKKLRSRLKGGQINVNNLDINGISPQHECAYQGYVKCLKVLRSHGADLNFQDSFGWTCLHAAICGEKFKCVKYLVSSGVKVNREDLTGWTPLHVAVFLGNKDVVNLLVKAGGDVLFEATNGLTPLQLAIDLKDEIILKYFLELDSLLVRRL